MADSVENALALGKGVLRVAYVQENVPEARWEVRREMLRRIKERFQKLQMKVLVPG